MPYPIASHHRQGLSNTSYHSLSFDVENEAIVASLGVTLRAGNVLVIRAGAATHEREALAVRTAYGLEVEIKPLHDYRGATVEIVGIKV